MGPNDFPHSSPDQYQRAVSGLNDSGVTPDTKYTKDEVNYRPAGSSSTRCEGCKHFAWSKGSQGTGNCELVSGLIKPDHVSDKYEPSGGGLVDLITG